MSESPVSAAPRQAPLAAQFRPEGFRSRWCNCSEGAELLASLGSDAMNMARADSELTSCALNELLELAWRESGDRGSIAVDLRGDALDGVSLRLQTSIAAGARQQALRTALERLLAGETAASLFDEAVLAEQGPERQPLFGVLWLLAHLDFELEPETSLVDGSLQLGLRNVSRHV